MTFIFFLNMDEIKKMYPSVYQRLIEGNVESLFTILNKTINELQDLTHVKVDQLEDIKNTASEIAFKQEFLTADQVLPWERISTGCSSIDKILSGGLPINGITEIYGCSGVGKTQLCLQLALMVQLPRNKGGKEKEVVYICTEDIFPTKRFHQLANIFKDKHNLDHLDFEGNVYLHHAADFEQLRRCLCVHLPKLLSKRNIGLLIIDSIAGVFRSENSDICYTSRGRDISYIASTLHTICNKYKVGIVCVNQVSENLITEKTEPCLGLAWSNNVTCRFCITRCNTSGIREFQVIFAPDVGNINCHFTITEDGLVSIL